MNRRQQTYLTLWRWHFYAGIFCLPLIIALAGSGAIYLFKPQFDRWRDAAFMGLETQAQRSAPNQQIASALMAVPGARFQSYRLPQHNSDAVVIALMSEGKRYLVYVNPFSLAILKIDLQHTLFMERVKQFHGELLSGTVGSLAVELAACWAIVLIATGLYLWWPRDARGLAGVLYPRTGLGGRRLWRDLHAVVGIWAAFFALFLLISGLPWALVWGNALKQVRSIGEPPIDKGWTISAQEQQHHWQESTTTHYDLPEAVLDTAGALNFAAPVELSLGGTEHNIWKLSSHSQNRTRRAEAWIVGASGQVIARSDFAEKPLIDRAVGVSVAAHEGQLFGWLNQLLGVTTALALIFLSISGFILWRKRKPKSGFGAPPPPANTERALLAIVGLAALLLPLLLISLIAIALLETLLLPRLPKLRFWLAGS